jgi:alkylated DNA repair dioxygenase AlkB
MTTPTPFNERYLPADFSEEISDFLTTKAVNPSTLEGIDGVYYKDNYLTEEEEQDLIRLIDSNQFSQVLQRRQQFYGKVYYHTKSNNSLLQPILRVDALDPGSGTISSGTITRETIASGTITRESTTSGTIASGTITRESTIAYNSIAQITKDPTPNAYKIDPFNPLIQKLISDSYFPHESPNQVLINEYKSSLGIRSHFEDFKAFGNNIITISLGCPVWMTLKKPRHLLNSCPVIEGYCKILLKPRSVFVMARECRREWRHGISKSKKVELGDGSVLKRNEDYRRISLTIRELLDSRKQADGNEEGWFDSDIGQGDACDCNDKRHGHCARST